MNLTANKKSFFNSTFFSFLLGENLINVSSTSFLCCDDVNISVFHTRFDDEPSFGWIRKVKIFWFQNIDHPTAKNLHLSSGCSPFYESSQLLRLLQSCSYVTLRLSKFLESDFKFSSHAEKEKKMLQNFKNVFFF